MNNIKWTLFELRQKVALSNDGIDYENKEFLDADMVREILKKRLEIPIGCSIMKELGLEGEDEEISNN